MEGLKGEEGSALKRSKKTIRSPEIKKRKGKGMIKREVEKGDEKKEKMDK